MIVRPETEKDLAAIQSINVAAFADHPFSHQTEHLIVNALRDAGALTLSLVAEDAGEVVGHIAFSPALIDGNDLKWFTLGPIAVAPNRQRQGIGSRLVETGIETLRRLGANGCLLVGDPAYYLRFGFRHSQSLSVEHVPPEYFMCLPLAGEIPHGAVEHHPGFYVTA